MSKEQEYKDMFYAESFENYEELNRLFITLEKNNSDKKAIDSIFRITHTLKGNAMGLGFSDIADLAHVMEDVFSHIKNGTITLDNDLFTNLFKANDKLGDLIDALKNPRRVSYKGIRTKLEVFLKNNEPENVSEETEATEIIVEEIPVVETITEKPQDIEAGNNAEYPIDEENPENVQSTIEEVSNTSEENDDTTSENESEEIAETDLNSEVSDFSVEEDLDLEEEEEEEEEEEQTELKSKISFSDQVQIPVHKLDNLLNLVGELIIEKDGLVAKSVEGGKRGTEYSRLHRITSDLQYAVMDVRLVQVGFMFNKFHRIVRDVANIESKDVNLILQGTEIEIDRNIIKIMSDSLVHLVRNAVSHGVESPQDRIARGKSSEGNITLSATNEKDTVIIKVSDDGAGIDHVRIRQKAIEKGIISKEFAAQMSKEDIYMLIFEPGFSNADKITEVSGRGVGMDVVKRATESIGGKIAVDTVLGEGTTVTLSLPSSMAVKGALLFEMEQQEYAVPLSYTEAVVSLRKPDIHKINSGLMANYLNKTISIVFLKDLYKLEKLSSIKDSGVLHESYNRLEDNNQKLDVLVTSYGGKYVGFVVDKLLQQKEIVEKTLASPLDHIELYSGATILGNGNVCLVLDIATILRSLFKEKM